MIEVEAASAVLLELALKDGSVNFYPRAEVYDSASSLVTTVNLAHVAGGLYQGTLPAQAVGQYSVIFLTYSDPGHTTLAGFERVSEHIQWVLTVGERVWTEAILAHVSAGSAAEALFSAFGNAGGNVRDDALAYDGNSRPVTLRRRIFPNAATANASTIGGTGEGEIITVTISAAHVDATKWSTLLRTI